MSVFSELDNMVLRETSNPPLTTKGSELTFEEMDARIIAMYDVVQSIVSGVNVTAYDAGTTYDAFDTDIRKRFASYDSKIWEAAYVGSPSTFSGQTPEEGVYWTQVTLAELMPNILPLANFATHISNTNNACPTYCAKLTIPSADVLQLNSTPLTIVAAQGAGTAIEVLSASLQITFNSVAYATNTNLQLYANGSSEIQTSNSINQIADAFSKFEPEIGATGSIQFVENADLLVNVGGGNPTAGDSDITVYVLYRIINV
jgi:hypothetical protein